MTRSIALRGLGYIVLILEACLLSRYCFRNARLWRQDEYTKTCGKVTWFGLNSHCKRGPAPPQQLAEYAEHLFGHDLYSDACHTDRDKCTMSNIKRYLRQYDAVMKHVQLHHANISDAQLRAELLHCNMTANAACLQHIDLGLYYGASLPANIPLDQIPETLDDSAASTAPETSSLESMLCLVKQPQEDLELPACSLDSQDGLEFEHSRLAAEAHVAVCCAPLELMGFREHMQLCSGLQPGTHSQSEEPAHAADTLDAVPDSMTDNGNAQVAEVEQQEVENLTISSDAEELLTEQTDAAEEAIASVLAAELGHTHSDVVQAAPAEAAAIESKVEEAAATCAATDAPAPASSSILSSDWALLAAGAGLATLALLAGILIGRLARKQSRSHPPIHKGLVEQVEEEEQARYEEERNAAEHDAFAAEARQQVSPDRITGGPTRDEPGSPSNRPASSGKGPVASLLNTPLGSLLTGSKLTGSRYNTRGRTRADSMRTGMDGDMGDDASEVTSAISTPASALTRSAQKAGRALSGAAAAAAGALLNSAQRSRRARGTPARSRLATLADDDEEVQEEQPQQQEQEAPRTATRRSTRRSSAADSSYRA